MAAVRLFKAMQGPAIEYYDQKSELTKEEQQQRARESTTLYVGNLSFHSTEEQILELFSKFGEVSRIIMGLDRMKKTPCGFCFVEYFERADVDCCLKYCTGLKIDDRPIRVDVDPGFVEGRQYGRGRAGGQIRDEMRMDYDSARGGFGKLEPRGMLATPNAMMVPLMTRLNPAAAPFVPLNRPSKKQRFNPGAVPPLSAMAGEGNEGGEGPIQSLVSLSTTTSSSAAMASAMDTTDNPQLKTKRSRRNDDDLEDEDDYGNED